MKSTWQKTMQKQQVGQSESYLMNKHEQHRQPGKTNNKPCFYVRRGYWYKTQRPFCASFVAAQEYNLHLLLLTLVTFRTLWSTGNASQSQHVTKQGAGAVPWSARSGSATSAYQNKGIQSDSNIFRLRGFTERMHGPHSEFNPESPAFNPAGVRGGVLGQETFVLEHFIVGFLMSSFVFGWSIVMPHGRRRLYFWGQSVI